MNAVTGKNTVIDCLKRQWRWTMAMGVALIVLGTIALGMSVTVTLSGVMFLGALMIFAGAAQIVEVFQTEGWKKRLWNILIATVYAYAGTMMIVNPALASAGLTLFIAGALIAIGIMRIFAAWQLRGNSGWGWGVFSGAITATLGTMIASRWPISGLWVIGMFLAIEMILAGWTNIILALTARRAARVVYVDAKSVREAAARDTLISPVHA